MNRGDVVLVHVPFVGSFGGKIRPAVVVQSDALNRSIRETIIAEISSNLSQSTKPHQSRIDISTDDGAATGLLVNSVVRCERLHTIPQSDIQRVIGHLSPSLMKDVEASLKSTLQSP